MTKAPVLIITDSDGEHDRTLDMLNRGVELDSWKYSIPDPSIETWIGVDRKEFMRSFKGDKRKPKLHELANNINLEELASKDDSFRSFYEWVKNA